MIFADMIKSNDSEQITNSLLYSKSDKIKIWTKERMNNINSTQNIVTQYLKPKNR